MWAIAVTSTRNCPRAIGATTTVEVGGAGPVELRPHRTHGSGVLGGSKAGRGGHDVVEGAPGRLYDRGEVPEDLDRLGVSIADPHAEAVGGESHHAGDVQGPPIQHAV
jgi:hypothetical protein